MVNCQLLNGSICLEMLPFHGFVFRIVVLCCHFMCFNFFIPLLGGVRGGFSWRIVVNCCELIRS